MARAISLSLLLALAACSALLPTTPPTRQMLTRQPTRLTFEDVEAIAISRIQSFERMAGGPVAPIRIESITASDSAEGIVWHVRAQGTFATARGRDGGIRTPEAVTSTSWTATDLAMGFP